MVYCFYMRLNHKNPVAPSNFNQTRPKDVYVLLVNGKSSNPWNNTVIVCLTLNSSLPPYPPPLNTSLHLSKWPKRSCKILQNLRVNCYTHQQDTVRCCYNQCDKIYSLQNKIWNLPDRSTILPSLLDRPKFCRSGSLVRHFFWRLYIVL